MRRPTAAVGSTVFFLVAPGTVGGLIPWLLTGWQVRDPLPPYWAPMRVLGVILLVAGLIVLVQAFVRFVMEGLGTPAPIAAPERLVVGGLYRYVRNPMYVAILGAIIGQALLLGQLGLLLYAAALWLISAGFVRWYEEPTLTRRFGTEYEAYRRAVPAWWPRLRPWKPSERDEPGARWYPADDFGKGTYDDRHT
jgi:protein-S-isoprenylcysteine O-methyltransferase Ste14